MVAPTRPQGFTLIELVCVIAILGILAATAMPRFTDLAKEARIAKLNALAGALQSTAQMWNMVCRLQKEDTCQIGHVDITKNGITADMYNGFPDAGNTIGAKQIDGLINTSGFTISLSNPVGYYTRFSLPDRAYTTKCAVTYCVVSANPLPDYCSPDTFRIVVSTDEC